MNKKITKKCIGAFFASIVLTTCPTALGGVLTTTITKNQNTNAANLTIDHSQLNETILLKVKELTDQGMNLEQLQIELQNMLNNIKTDIQTKGQNSMSLRGFYGNDIFSCRGFA
jgi:DNA-directed RNA polymerase subunit L